MNNPYSDIDYRIQSEIELGIQKGWDSYVYFCISMLSPMILTKRKEIYYDVYRTFTY